MSSSSFKNLPRHVQKELLRHVNRSGGGGSASSVIQSNSSAAAAAGPPAPYDSNPHLRALQQERRKGVRQTLTASLLLFSVASSFPLLAWWWIGNLSERDGELTSPQIRRGAFGNSGSRDVGRDPDWDFDLKRHKYEKGFGEISEEELSRNNNRSNGLWGSPTGDSKEIMKQYDPYALTAAARGLHPQVSHGSNNLRHRPSKQQ
ncbi:hypothetical protein ACA910_010868 [Epithemia clementina (nom. ined.)]